MSPKSRQALILLAVALGLGVAADLLSRTLPARPALASWIVLSLVVWLIFSRGLQLTLPAGPVESAILLLLGPR